VRIALVTPRYAPDVGGVEKHVERLACHMLDRGHSVEVLTQSAGRDFVENEQRDGVVVRRFRQIFASAEYAFAPSLGRYLRASRERYDLVHAHNYHSLTAVAAAWSRPRAFVFTPHYHGTSASAFRRWLHVPYRRIGGSVIRRADHVLCVSGREAGLMRRDFPWIGDKVSVIHNGVDLRQILSATPQTETRRVILSAGRLEPYKGVDRTIEAMTHLSDEYVLRITGEGSASPALLDQVESLGLKARVEFLGRVELASLYSWFQTASVYVTMSRIEAMPLTPLEALAAGAQVVASDIPAHREVMEATQATVDLVSPDASPERLAATIARAAQCQRSQRAPAVLDWADVGDRTLAVYEKAVKKPQRVS
jgi:glycosyltransferase involved in cell wall biosynthesis